MTHELKIHCAEGVRDAEVVCAGCSIKVRMPDTVFVGPTVECGNLYCSEKCTGASIMSLLELFIEECLSEKEKVYVSNPLNTKHQAMFDSFKKGALAVGQDGGAFFTSFGREL